MAHTPGTASDVPNIMLSTCEPIPIPPLRPVVMGGARDAFASVAALGMGAAAGGVPPGPGTGNQNPPPKAPKEKKVAGFKKQTQQKIAALSGKLTDLKVLRNKVENSPLLIGCI